MKHGLLCVPACKNCTGELCCNVDLSGAIDCKEDGLDDFDIESNNQELFPNECLTYDVPWVNEETVEAQRDLFSEDFLDLETPWFDEEIVYTT